MSDMSEVNRYNVGIRSMDWSSTMDRIQRNGENAIVRDQKQEGPIHSRMGDYYDVWVDGALRGSFGSEREAIEAMEACIMEGRT
jgi:hypothetical protein